MPLPGCQLSYFSEPPTGYIRIVGRAAVEGARDFKILVERLLADGAEQICLDLSACLLMDSTFSGVLAHLASCRSVSGRTQSNPTLVLFRPNERVKDLLDSLGVLPLVGVLPESPQIQTESEATLVPAGGSRTDTAQCCLEAHRLLMALRPENVARFSELTRMLEQQLGEQSHE